MAYRQAGEAGLVDARMLRGKATAVDPRWDETVLIVAWCANGHHDLGGAAEYGSHAAVGPGAADGAFRHDREGGQLAVGGRTSSVR